MTKFFLLSANNMNYGIDMRDFNDYKSTHKAMVNECKSVANECDEPIVNIEKNSASIFDGEDLYYWQIRKLDLS